MPLSVSALYGCGCESEVAAHVGRGGRGEGARGNDGVSSLCLQGVDRVDGGTHEVVPLEALCGEGRRLSDGRPGEGSHREDGGELEHVGGSRGGLVGDEEVRLDRREVRRAEQSLWRGGERERGSEGGWGASKSWRRSQAAERALRRPRGHSANRPTTVEHLRAGASLSEWTVQTKLRPRSSPPAHSATRVNAIAPLSRSLARCSLHGTVALCREPCRAGELAGVSQRGDRDELSRS